MTSDDAKSATDTEQDGDNLFEGPHWKCTLGDCDGIVTAETHSELGPKIDAHLGEHHDTTLQAYYDGEASP